MASFLAAPGRCAPRRSPPTAALLNGFLALAEASGESALGRGPPPRWPARSSTDFWDAGRGGLYTTADDGEALIVRQKDVLDSATPST